MVCHSAAPLVRLESAEQARLLTACSGATGVAYTHAITGYTNRYNPTGATTSIPTTVPADERPLAGTYATTYTYTPITQMPATTSYCVTAGSA